MMLILCKCQKIKKMLKKPKKCQKCKKRQKYGEKPKNKLNYMIHNIFHIFPPSYAPNKPNTLARTLNTPDIYPCESPTVRLRCRSAEYRRCRQTYSVNLMDTTIDFGAGEVRTTSFITEFGKRRESRSSSHHRNLVYLICSATENWVSQTTSRTLNGFVWLRVINKVLLQCVWNVGPGLKFTFFRFSGENDQISKFGHNFRTCCIKNGLEQLDYTRKELRYCGLYTHLLVDLNAPK